jgi:acetyl-CoA carboxylase biotin carboxylase subunit
VADGDNQHRIGWRIPADYDSLLAKVVVWAPDRPTALDRMDRALGESRIAGPGIRTTDELLRRVLADPTFRAGGHTTALLGALAPGRRPTRRAG